jgi:hypothetical protein
MPYERHPNSYKMMTSLHCDTPSSTAQSFQEESAVW